MAVTLSTAAANAACNAVVDLVDVNPPGDLVIMTAADAVLVTFELANPAFGNAGAVNPGEAIAAAIADVAATGTGTAAKFAAKDGNGTTIWSGTVTLTGGGGDITVDNTSIVTGQNCSVTSWKHTHS